MLGDNGPLSVELNSIPDSFGASTEAGTYIIPDAELLFQGDFKRAGHDLKIIGHDGKTFVVHGYFKIDNLHTLFAPDGAALTGDIVAALAGPLAPGEYAQATAPQSSAQPIGRVATAQGTAVAVRNGVAVTLNVGDAVFKGDVIQTQGDSKIGIIFGDGTTFDLGANARMVLNDFVYNPAPGSVNSALINLVQGSITFVAGEVAHSGDMKVNTPVATIGIRGTAVQVDIDVNNGTTKLSVLIEPGGHVGSFNIYSLSGQLIGTVNNANNLWTVTPTSQLQAVAAETQKTPDQMAQSFAAVQTAFQTQSIGQTILQQQPVPPSQPNQQSPQNQPDQNQHDNQQLNQNPTQQHASTQIGSTDVSTTTIKIDATETSNTTTPQTTVVTPPPESPPTIPLVLAPLPTPPTPPTPPLQPQPPSVNTQVFFEANSANTSIHVSNVNAPVNQTGVLLFTGGDTHSVSVTPRAGDVGSLSAAISHDTNDNSTEGNIAYTYTAPQGQSSAQPDVFDVMVTDKLSGSIATASISFVLQNHNPVAMDATYTVTETQIASASSNSQFVLPNVLANVSDPDGDTVTVSAISAPTVIEAGAGLVVLSVKPEVAAAGEVARYDIQTNYGDAHVAVGRDGQIYLWSNTGNDPFKGLGANETATINFNYTVDDGFGGSATASASITINGANDAAVVSGITSGAVTEAGGVNNGTPGTPTFSGTLTDTDVDNPANTFQAVAAGTASDGGYGSYAMAAGGTWTYTLNNTNAAVQALNVGGTLTDTFTVHTQDGTAQQVTVTINGANDAAVVSGTTSGAVTAASTLVATGALTDTDVDNPANTFQAVTTATAGSQGFGSYTVDGSGNWSYTLDSNNATVQALGPAGTLTDTFAVHTQDGTAQTITITISGSDHAPTLAPVTGPTYTDTAAADHFPAAAGTLLGSDVDSGTTLTYGISGGSHDVSLSGYDTSKAGSYGTLYVSSTTGAYSFVPSDGAINALPATTTTDSFTVTVSDGTLSTQQPFTVTLNGANDAAVVSGTTSGAVTEAGGVNNGTLGTPTFSGTLTDTDVDNPANTFQAVAAGTASDSGYGSYAMAAGGTWTYTLNNTNAAVQALNVGGTLTDTFTVHTQDGTAQQVTVTINGANDAPVAVNDTNTITAGNGPISGNLLANDSDPENDTLTVTNLINDASGGGTITVDGTYGEVVVTEATGHYTYTLGVTPGEAAAVAALAAGAQGQDDFIYTVSDGNGGTANAHLTIAVTGVNDAPVINLAPTISEVPIPNPLPSGTDAAAQQEVAPVISQDGRWVAFFSSEVNPDTNNGNGESPGDVYLYDRQTGTTTVLTDAAHTASLTAGETFGNGLLSISADGGTVLFRGQLQVADDQSPTGFDQRNQLIVYDRASDTLRVLTNPDNNNEPYNVDDTSNISGNGAHIVFDATVFNDSSPPAQHVYVTDLSGHIQTDIAPAQLGIAQPSDPNEYVAFSSPDISGGGRYLTFWAETRESGTGNDTPVGQETLYTYDRSNGTYTIIATTTASDNDWPASMSNDGRYVVFQSDSDALDVQAGGTANDKLDIFVWDRNANGGAGGIIGVTDSSFVQSDGDSERAAINPGNGRYVIFASTATNLVPGDSNGQGDAFIYDTQTHTFQLLSGAMDGTQGDGDSTLGADLAFGGNGTVFGSTAGNLVVPNDTDGGLSDIFVVDRSAGTVGGVTQGDTTPAFAGTPANSLSTHGAINFTDVDLTDTHTVQVIGSPTITMPTGFVVPAGGLGTFTPTVVETAGSGFGQVAWTFTVDNAATAGIGALQQVQQIYTIQLSDGHGGVVTQNVTVSVFGINDAPVLTLPSTTASVNSGAPLALTGAHVADPDSGDVITLNLSVANGTLVPIDSTLPAGVTVDSSTPSALQVHGSAAAIDQLLNDGVTYTSNNNYVGSDILTVAVHDALGASDSHQVAITVNSVANQPAVISGTTSGAVTEAGGVNNGTAGTPTFSGTLTDTDVDNPANTFQAVAAGTASDGGYGSYAMAAGGTWTYTLNNNNAAVQALNVGGTLTDTFTVHTQDGTAQQVTVTINGANDAAVLAGTASGAVTEAGGVNNGTPGTPTFSGTLTDTDVDNPANTFQAVAAGTASDGGYGSYAMAAGGTWTYTLNNTNAAVQALNVGGTLTDTFTVHTQDGTAQQVTVTINGANDAPTVTDAGNTIGYTELQVAPPAIDAVLTVADVDNATLASATVSIASGFFAGDALNFTNQNGITGSYNGTTGVLTLSGTATVAQYQAALESVTFSSSSANPTNFATDTGRSISWVVNDGTLNSAAQTTTVTITAVDNAPVISNVAGNAAYTEAGAATTLSSGAMVSDVDNTTLASATVSISAGFLPGDTLAATTAGTNITSNYNSTTGVLTLSGPDTLAHYQAVLDSVNYASSSANPANFGADTSRTASWGVNDGTLNSAAQTTTVNITAVDNAPVIANVSGTVSTNQNTPVPLVAPSGLVSDVDAAPSDLLLASLSVTHGTLTPIGSVAGLTIVNGQDGSNGTLSFTGTQAAIQNAIRAGVTYAPNLNYNGSDTLTFTVNDQGHSGSGGPQSTSTTVGITVVNQNLDDWTNSSGGNWSTLSNWDNGLPTTTTTATLDAAGIYTVTSSGTVAINQLISTATATLDITGGTFTVSDYGGQGPLVLAGGALTIIGASGTTASLTQSGGELNGAGSLTATGASNFSGGTQSGSGMTIAQGGVSFGNGSPGPVSFGLDGGRTLQLGGTSTVMSASNGGTATIDLNATNPNTGVSDPGSGVLTIASGATFNDQTTTSSGGLTISAPNRGGSDTGATAAVNNLGTFEKTGSATTSTISTLFNNSSIVDVESGTLNLSGGGTDVGATYKGVGTIEFGGGTRTLDATSSIIGNALFAGGASTVTTVNGGVGTGLMSVTAGTATFNGTVSTGGLTQSGGELNGAGSLTATGASNFSGGTQSGSGMTIAQGGVSFGNGSPGPVSFGLDGGRTLQLGGTSTVMSASNGGTATIDLNATNPNTGVSDPGSGVLTIASGATFNDQTTTSSGGLTISAPNRGGSDTGATAAVNNLGTFEKTGSATTSTISTLFNNSSIVDVESGTLNLSGGGTDVGATYKGVGTIEFGGGTRTLDATSSIIGNALFAGGASTVTTVNGGVGTGLMSVTAGTATFNGTVSTGGLTQSGGELNGAGSLTATGASNFSGGTQSGSGMTIAQGGVSFGNGSPGPVSFGLDGGRTLQLGGTSTVMSASNGGTATIDLNATNPNTGVSDPGSGVLTIASGATFNDQTTTSSGGLTISAPNRGGSDTGATAAVNNLGTFEKTGSATTSTISTLFNNSSIVDVESGTLNLSGGGTDVGATYKGAGTIEFGGGTRNFTGSSVIESSALTNNGSIILNGGMLDITSAVTGTGSAIIAGGTLELGSSDPQTVAFSNAGATLKLDNPTSTTFTGHINGLIVGDTIDLTNTTVTSAIISGASLIVNESNKSTLTYTVAGSLTGNAFIVSSDGNGGTNLTLEPVGYLTASPSTYYWSDAYIPWQPTTGVHLFAASIEIDTFSGVAAMLYSSTGLTPSYDPVNDPVGPYTITRTAVPLDPFFLPTLAGSQVVIPPTSLTLPARLQLLLPAINTNNGLETEGIGIYVTQDAGGDNLINQTFITGGGGDYSPLSVGSPTQIENAGTNTVYNLQVHFRQDNGTAPASYLSTYSVAWDQYDASTGTYSLRFQIFNPDGSASSSVTTPTITSSGGTSVTVSATPSAIGATTLPAWEFRNASGAYVLAVAEYNSTNNTDFIQFQGYTTSGATNSTNFKIIPDLSHYAAGATNLITQDVIPSVSPNPGNATPQLKFLQLSAASANDYVIGWNETVTGSSGNFLGDQVEFDVDKSGTGVVFQFTAQLVDAQSVILTSYILNGIDFAVLAYGDATATHLVDFEVTGGGATVTEIASVTDATTQPYSNLISLGDGRITIEYDDTLDASSTSQFDLRTFDFRTSGLAVDDSSLSDGQDKYVAGTHYNDTFTGENGVNNLYYYVGQDHVGPSPPSDIFNGGNNGWNVAIFPDARANYTIQQAGSSILITNVNDPAYAGSLTVNGNVQALAFDPTHDPLPHSDGSVEATGDTLVIFNNFTNSATIDPGATLEFVTSDSGPVTFAGVTETLRLDSPASFGNGHIDMLGGGDVLDLKGFDVNTAVTPGSFANGSTTLTVSDPGHQNLSLTLAGDYSSSTWAVASDGDTNSPGVAIHSTLPADDTAGGTLSGVNSSDLLTVAPEPANSLGLFTVTAGNGGSADWHFNASNNELAQLADQTLFYSVTDQTNTTATQTISVSVGANDQFEFQINAGTGTHAMVNFSAAVDQNSSYVGETISLAGFTNAQDEALTVNDILADLTSDSHGNAVVNLNSHDSITFEHISVSIVQAQAANLFHFGGSLA